MKFSFLTNLSDVEVEFYEETLKQIGLNYSRRILSTPWSYQDFIFYSDVPISDERTIFHLLDIVANQYPDFDESEKVTNEKFSLGYWDIEKTYESEHEHHVEAMIEMQSGDVFHYVFVK